MTNGEQLAAVLDSCAHAIQAFAQTLRVSGGFKLHTFGGENCTLAPIPG